MKMKKLIAAGLTMAMVGSMSMTAFAAPAADGAGATAPKGETTAEGTGLDGTSTGSATITGDGTTFNTLEDDDTAVQTDDTNGADINVWAKVIDASTPTYKLDIAWGAMKFEYSSGEGTWNTSTHTYDGASGTGAWTVDGYLDGTNNQITVTNHSNKAVDTTFAYAMTEQHLFNADTSTVSAVKGNFFEDNTKAAAAALVLDDTGNVTDLLTDSKIALHSADKYYASTEDKTAGEGSITAAFTDENKATTGREKNVYFAFSGKPDTGVGASLDSFTKVGVITVTVAKMSDEDLATFEY